MSYRELWSSVLSIYVICKNITYLVQKGVKRTFILLTSLKNKNNQVVRKWFVTVQVTLMFIYIPC